MLLDERISVTRRVAHDNLDREFRLYDTQRRHPDHHARLEQLGIAEADRHSEVRRPVPDVEDAARALVGDRYTTAHVDLNHSLYAHSVGCNESDCDSPSCQRQPCDDCHRVLALMYATAFCGSREEYKPMLDWIMDQEFLA